VENQLEKALATLEGDPKTVASLTGFPWLVGINWNAT
jgi:hypothetical protein